MYNINRKKEVVMKTVLEESILKELNHFNFRGNEISMIMSRLYNNEIKNMFLSFLIENRRKMITISMIFSKLRKLNV